MKNNIFYKLAHFIANSNYRTQVLAGRAFYNKMNDEDYLKKVFQAKFGYPLDLENPKTFNEKLQRLKLYDRKPQYTQLVDKYAVRPYIKEKIGEEYLVPLLNVREDPDQINFASLPDRFILKCNHNSGSVYICKNRENFDFKAAKEGLKRDIEEDYYLRGREWPYKDVQRKIIAEEYLEDKNGDLIDYKFFCFDGYVDCVMVCVGRQKGEVKFYFFDRERKLLRYNVAGKNAPEDFTLEKPENIEEMFDLAEVLSEGLPFVRIDLYSCDDKIFFGEFTLYPGSGFDVNLLPETDRRFGDLIKLPQGDKTNDKDNRISN